MKSFKDLGITAETKGFTGNKIEIERILNTEVIISAYRISDSKFAGKGNGKCLHLQIESNGVPYVVFSGSGVLMDTIERIPKKDFPFKTVIKKQDRRLEFT